MIGRNSFEGVQARVKASATATAAATHLVRYAHHQVPPSNRQNLYYSLWYYSVDRSTISLRMQERRRRKPASLTAEKAFGAILRAVRKERGLSQEALAFESGYHATYIGQMERGEKSPSLRTIMNLARALRTPGSEMLRRVEARLTRTVPEKPQR